MYNSKVNATCFHSFATGDVDNGSLLIRNVSTLKGLDKTGLITDLLYTVDVKKKTFIWLHDADDS